MAAWLDSVWHVVNGRTRMARRNVKDVLKYSSEAALLREARARDFHVAIVGEQYFVFRDAIKVKC